MTIQSLGYRTDLFFSRLNGEVTDRGEYLSVQTPSNPTFWWGNYLLFKRAPVVGDAANWLEAFHTEHRTAQHIAIGFDSREPGDTSEFTLPFEQGGAGLTLETSDVMTATALHEPPHPNQEAELRPLRSDADWAARLELSRAVHTWGGEFMERSNLARRAQVAAGHGQWFGAFLDGQLVSSLGVFNVGDGLGRFQSVETHPAFERRGLCGTLVHFAGTRALSSPSVDRLVMVADPEYHAIRVYESVGFQTQERQYAISKTDAPA
jgi:RimJ/RimL family protein N-acetyltransferase